MGSPKDPAIGWISSLDVETTHSATLSSLLEGASRWIIEDRTFTAWLDGRSDSPVLWAHGLPGSGNTSCTAVVIDHLVRCVAGKDTAVAYVYCDASKTAELTAVALLASVCRQIATQVAAAGRPLPALLTKLHAELGPLGEARRPSIDEVMLVLVALCEAFGRVFVCVDGLDECARADQRPILLQKLLWMCGRDVRLFVSSVTHGEPPEACKCNRDIVTAMAEMGASQVIVEAASEDVRKAVIRQLAERCPSAEKLLGDAGEQIEAVVDEIARDSDGMFVIASCLLDRKLRKLASLERRGNPERPDVAEPLLFYMRATADHIGKHEGELSFRKGEIIAVTEADTEYSFSSLWKGVVRGIAGEFPKALARKMESPDSDWQSGVARDAYAEWQDTLAAVENHPSRSRDVVFTVLCWLAHADGPLTMDDIVKALSWDVTAPPGHRILWRAGGVEIESIDERAGGASNTATASILDSAKGLLHFDGEKETVSVLDSLKLSDSELTILFPDGHQMIARTCLQILMRSPDVGKNAQPPDLMSIMMGRPDSRSYAERSWSHHVKLCKDDSMDELVADFLTRRSDSKPTWMEDTYMPFMDFYRVIKTDNETPVLKAARLGMDGVVKILLRRQSYDLNAVSYKSETALSVAVNGGFVSTVKLLYRHGASVEQLVENDDDSSVCADTLMQAAARNNDDVMVALLIKLGPDRNTPLGSRAPLETALNSKSIDVARMLVMHGAEITDWLMIKAITSGRLEIVKLIFERDDNTLATLKDRDARWKSEMLFAAVGTRSIPIADYMIHTLGASVNHLNYRGNSVLHEAANNHQLDMVKFLMDNTDDPMLPYRESDGANDVCNGETAVEAAMYYDYEQAWRVVDYLLGRMPPGVAGPVILGMAASALEHGQADYTKRLIAMVTPPLQHARLTCRASLMGMAAAKNNVEVLSMLFDGSMSAGIQDKHGTSPLHIAAENNSKEAIELIIGRGMDIDINAITTCGVTPVHVAVSEGHLDAVRVLARHGADLSSRAADGSSALVAAGCSIKLDVALALLEYDVNVDDFNLNGESILHYAVLDGNLELVRELVHLGVDKSISSRRGGTALHLAAHKGNENIVKLLLDAGAQVEIGYQYSGSSYEPPETDYMTPDVPWNRWGVYLAKRPERWCKIEPGWTPLHCAACSGHDDIARMLISSGADIQATGNGGETPLHVAASAAQATVIELLVDKGANVNTKTRSGETPLHWAARAAAAVEAKEAADMFKCACQQHKDDMYNRAHPDESKAECTELLLRLGAAPAEENVDGATPLVLAVAAGHGDAVKSLLKATRPATSTAAMYPELLRDIARRKKASAKALADLSASFSETPESQAAWCDVLGGACLDGNLDMAQLAIYKGATLPERVGAEGHNPLHHIVTHDELSDLVELVLSTRCGADVYACDSTGSNALHLAVAVRSKTESLPARDGNGSTLRVNHASDRRARIVAALLAAGAAPNTRTLAGDTALHLACAAGDARVVDILLAHGADADVRNAAMRTPLHAAVAGWTFVDIVALLLDAGGAHPSPRDAEGATPLHLVRETRTLDALNFLLDAGADIFAQARNGDAPLHRAVRRGNVTVMHRLLEVGADAGARDAKGRTCLHIAARYGYAHMLGELNTSRCALDAVDAAGWTAAHHAATKGHTGVLDALLAIGQEQGVDVLGAAVGAVPFESVVSRDEAERLRQLIRIGNSVSTTQTTVVVN